jgi:4-hydroxybenzoate polyprenyltransferase
MVKVGLGDTYDKTIVPNKVRAYADLTKPASSIGVMLTIPFAALFYGELYHTGGVGFVVSNWTTVLYASVTMLLLHGGSQAMNMAEDAHIDKQTDHKQTRPIPAGVVSAEEARSLAWIFMFAGVARAFTINAQFGLVCVLLAFFGIFYNLEPIRAKKYLWFNLSWQAASRGLFLYPATFAVWNDVWNPIAWVMGIAAFLLVLSMQNTADFSDVEIDREFDIVTPAVHHGLHNLTVIMMGIVVLMFAFITVSINFGPLPDLWSLYILAIPIMYSLVSLWRTPRTISDFGGNHISWYIFYLSLAGLYILPAFQLLITG